MAVRWALDGGSATERMGTGCGAAAGSGLAREHAGWDLAGWGRTAWFELVE